MLGLKHRQKVKSPQEEKEEEETKFPLAFHAEGKNVAGKSHKIWDALLSTVMSKNNKYCHQIVLSIHFPTTTTIHLLRRDI